MRVEKKMREGIASPGNRSRDLLVRAEVACHWATVGFVLDLKEVGILRWPARKLKLNLRFSTELTTGNSRSPAAAAGAVRAGAGDARAVCWCDAGGKGR